jgi:hypothetical protein
MRFLVTAPSLEKPRPRFPDRIKELRNLNHRSISMGPLPLTLEEVSASNDINRLLNEAARPLQACELFFLGDRNVPSRDRTANPLHPLANCMAALALGLIHDCAGDT